MIVTTTFTVEGSTIVDYKGLVRGIIVRAPTITQGIIGGLKNIIGGEESARTPRCASKRVKPRTMRWSRTRKHSGQTRSWECDTTLQKS
jgi:hypothetical protein